MLSVNVEKTPFYRMGMKDGIKEGIREGVENTLEKVAISMLKLNVDMEIIYKTTGLSLNRIGKLKEKMQKESV